MPLNATCQSYVPLLSPYLDGELSAADRASLERHLGACAGCAARVADLRAASALVRAATEMAADQADFSQFAQKVMARVTPHRPPLWERWRISLWERLTYQRGALAGVALALLALAFVAGALLRPGATGTPTGYAAERLTVQEVSADGNAPVEPLVIRAQNGDAIIWLVPSSKEGAAPSNSPPPAEGEDDGSGRPEMPQGGEL